MAIFAGQYNATIDDKGRVVLPSAFKKALSEMELNSVVLERNRRSKCLDIHTVKNWAKEVREFKAKLKSQTKPIHDKLLTLYFQNFVTATVAANGRINIPNHFLEYAELESSVTFIGSHSFIRLTAAESYDNLQVSDEEYLKMLDMLNEGGE